MDFRVFPADKTNDFRGVYTCEAVKCLIPHSCQLCYVKCCNGVFASGKADEVPLRRLMFFEPCTRFSDMLFQRRVCQQKLSVRVFHIKLSCTILSVFLAGEPC